MSQMPMRVLLINAPLTDLFTAYPGVFYLAGHLRNLGHDVIVEDLSLQFALKVFSRAGLVRVATALKQKYQKKIPPPKVDHFLKYEDQYLALIDVAIRHLQGLEENLSVRINSRKFYPPSPDESRHWVYEKSFERLGTQRNDDPLDSLFGPLTFHDRAKYLSSVFLRDIIGVINEGLDPLLGFANYGVFNSSQEHWPDVRPSDWKTRVERPWSICTEFMDELALAAVERYGPELIGISAPFNHTAFAALRMARAIKNVSQVPIVLGGHYATTSLRKLNDPWFFKFVDYVVLDNGEKPMELLIDRLQGRRSKSDLLRTYFLSEAGVQYSASSHERDVSQVAGEIPSYRGIHGRSYPSVVHGLGSKKAFFQSVFTNKLKLSHGCYWGKCTFCDTKLEYIGNYDPYNIDKVVEQMKRLMKETGSSAFHFVDEAMPPKLLRLLSEQIIKERLSVTWWGHVRLDEAIDESLAQLMARAGCIYVQAGIEAPVERLLKLMKKGVGLSQIARISRNLSKAGIFVEALLMYGFPTQTIQETIDGLEFVRQLFENKCIQGGGWGRFYITPHSTIVDDQESLGLEVDLSDRAFETWHFAHSDKSGIDHSVFEKGLRKAMESYQYGAGLGIPVHHWFQYVTDVPQASLPTNFVALQLTKAKVPVGISPEL